MSLTLITDVTTEPVTVDAQKSHMRLETDADDGYVLVCISAAREWIEGQTKHLLAPQTWAYGIDYRWPIKFGRLRVVLPWQPVVATASPSTTIITYVDDAGATQTLDQSLYTVAARNTGSFIVPAYDATWPTVQAVPDAITVQFQAGFTSSPKVLLQAAMILAAHFYEHRETNVPPPQTIEALISPYRAVTFR